MLPFAAPGDSTFRTLEEDDKASVLRTYARNRMAAPSPRQWAGVALINLTLLKGGACNRQRASRSSPIRLDRDRRTQSGRDLQRIASARGHSGRAVQWLGDPERPAPARGRVLHHLRQNVRSRAWVRSPRSATTTRPSIPTCWTRKNHSRTFDQLATVATIAAGESIDLGNIGILGCWVPDPNSPVNIVAESITAPRLRTKGSQIAVTSGFTQPGHRRVRSVRGRCLFLRRPDHQPMTSSRGSAVRFRPCRRGHAFLQRIGQRPCRRPARPNYYVGLLVDRENQLIESVRERQRRRGKPT